MKLLRFKKKQSDINLINCVIENKNKKRDIIFQKNRFIFQNLSNTKFISIY